MDSGKTKQMKRGKRKTKMLDRPPRHKMVESPEKMKQTRR